MAGTIAILAEKPSQRRNFAAALGGEQGTYNGERYVLVAAQGHVFEYVKPDEQVPSHLYSRYHDWALENLPWDERDFSWKRAQRGPVRDVIKTIRAAFASADEICIATDNDPTGEGELLAWEIIDELGFAHGRNKRFSRMFFEDESAAEVRRAFANRTPIVSMETDMDFVKAQYRCRWDMLSMQFTRAATRISGSKTVIRQGRLKSAMVRLVGDQLDAVNAYKKVPSYSNRFRDENGCVYTSPDEPTYPRREQVPQGAYKQAHVVVDSKQRKSTPPQRLMDLARLSAILAGRGISADRTLKAYQELYEAGILSYPRTEDKCITIEQFNEALPNVDAIAALVGVDASVLTHREPRPTHVKAGMAHGANRPGKKVPASLASLRAGYGDIAVEIYTILAKNFLAMFAEDYVYEQQKGHLQEYPGFTGSANVPVSLGWKAVSSDASDDDLDDASRAGLGTIADPFVHEGFPPRPAYPTMKWLMNQLEKHDVGTGATRASTYADVISPKTKGQLMREGKGGRIELTQEGKISHMLLPGTHIGDVAMTEQLMREMRDVAAGKLDPDEALSRVKGYVTDDIETMKANAPKMRETLGATMENERERVSGEWMGEKVSFNREFGGHRFTDEEVEALLAGKPITFEATSKRTNNTYTAAGILARQSYNGHDYVGFKLDFDLAPRDVPASWCEHTFTAQEKRDLKAGRAVHIEAAVSKKGRVFPCDVTWEEQDDGRMGITPSFASGGIPASWCEHTFTPAEKAELEAGNPVHVDDAKSKRTGKVFECDLTYKRREDGSMGLVPSFGRR